MAEQQHYIDPAIEHLRDVRLSKGIKQKDLAAAIGIGPTVASAYETGRSVPQIDVVRDWATALDHELQLVETGKNTPPRPRTDSPADDLVSVRLTQYQVALAMGMLVSAVHTTASPKMSADLQQIADKLAESLG